MTVVSLTGLIHSPEAFAMGRSATHTRNLRQNEIEAYKKDALVAAVFFKKQAASLPHSLLALGVTRVGDIDLNHYLDELEKIEIGFKFGYEVYGLSPDGSFRSGGANFSDQRRVEFNLRSMHELSGTKLFQVFAFHETLEALSIEDGYYQHSFGAYLRLLLQKETDRPGVWEIPYRSNPLLAGGGASGVGKGGDALILKIKNSVLMHFIKKWRTDSGTPTEREAELRAFMNRLNGLDVERSPTAPTSSNLCALDTRYFYTLGQPSQSDFKIRIYENVFKVRYFQERKGEVIPPCDEAYDRSMNLLIELIQRTPDHE
ncbi:MAG: hypothetical protein EOP09_09515 [Proteobacteria bacterium]|nr:MAG: hypothetical protein EOP09_09515 [Pseudomonadota bacterium]